jgi:hypothetical protein
LLGSGGHESRGIRISFEVHRLPWNGQTTFDLWTHRDVLYVLPESVSQKPIKFVSPIEADVLSQQAGANS